MFHQLVSHNSDLSQLVAKGYAVAFDSNHLVVRDVPYLDSKLDLQWGAIVTKLEFIDNEKVTQQDHQIFFAGSVPYGLNGLPISGLGGGATQVQLSEACKDVVVQRSFSAKPTSTGKYIDFFHKVDTYVDLIAGPAMARHNADPHTFRSVEEVASESVFKFKDTLTSLAGISELSTKFENEVIAVIGVGGTGSYILDFLVKTPVREIRIFDSDTFHVHNAFRSPGRLEDAELGKAKAEVYGQRYENFRTGLSARVKFVDSTNAEDLEGVTFAFVSVDKGSSRAGIFEMLLSKEIPFIDVGMGLNRKHGPIGGMLRATYYSSEDGRKVRDMGLAELVDSPNDEYRTNIQIAELNALNACLAVIKFKQFRGFYFQAEPNYHYLLGIGDLHITSDSEIK